MIGFSLLAIIRVQKYKLVICLALFVSDVEN